MPVMTIYKSIQYLAKLFCAILIFFLVHRGYAMYYYTYVLQENPSLKPSVTTPVLTRFSDTDSRLNNLLGSQLNTYIINLDRRTDRWKTIKPKLDMIHNPYIRLSAIDGKEIPSDILRINADEHKSKELFGYLLANGEIGCYLSHYFAIQDFMESSSDYALILEDDIEFSPQELTSVIQDLLVVKDEWDIANLHAQGGRSPKHHTSVKTLTHTKRNLVYFTTPTASTAAYLINRKAGQALLCKGLPVLMPYDWYLIREWDLGVKYRAILPSLKLHPYSKSSDIQGQGRPESEPEYSHYTSRMFRMASKIAHYYYNFIARIRP